MLHREKRRRSWLWVFPATLALLFLMIGAYVKNYISLETPIVQKTLTNPIYNYPIQIYDTNGQLLQVFGDSFDPVKIDQVPRLFIRAVMAIEDKNFYDHSGVSTSGILRAGWLFLTRSKSKQGASTITMQVAKNYFLLSPDGKQPKKNLAYKIKQILLAIIIDHQFSKKKILELYFNGIYLGNHAQGIVAAARVYYNKTLDQLSLSQDATLAGMIQAPSIRNPRSDKTGTKTLERRNEVLKRMLAENYITPAAYNAALREPLTLPSDRPPPGRSANYIAEMARLTIQQNPTLFGNRPGLKIYTTVDQSLQAAANAAVAQGLEAYHTRFQSDPEIPEAAFVALNPNTGAILALVGGSDFFANQFNRAMDSKRNIGSSIKPFIYSSALDTGEYTMDSTFPDSPFCALDANGRNWCPQNAHDEFTNTDWSLSEALIKSNNTITVRLVSALGIPYVSNYLLRFGFDKESIPHYLPLALGTLPASPVQLARGYAVFANGGYLVTPYFIEKIVDAFGNTIYQHDNTSPITENNRVITPENDDIMTSVLKEVMTRGTGAASSVLKRNDLAGKTGTTNEYRDAWFTGYTPDILATVWVGHDDYSPLANRAYGASAALPIWINFMQVALQKFPDKTPPPPPAEVNPAPEKQASAEKEHEWVNPDTTTPDDDRSTTPSASPSDQPEQTPDAEETKPDQTPDDTSETPTH